MFRGKKCPGVKKNYGDLWRAPSFCGCLQRWLAPRTAGEQEAACLDLPPAHLSYAVRGKKIPLWPLKAVTLKEEGCQSRASLLGGRRKMSWEEISAFSKNTSGTVTSVNSSPRRDFDFFILFIFLYMLIFYLIHMWPP